MINNFPLLSPVERKPNPEYFTIVCLANLRPQKDHGTLIKAVELLLKQGHHKKIKVILAGSFDNSDYTCSIKLLINELSLQDIIEIPGPVEDTASLLASADCGVLSSISEGLPVALLEYGMAGLPVVVTDVGECAEVTGRGKYGHVVPPGNYEALAGKLKVLVENQAEGENIGKMFRAHILSEYGQEHFMQKYRYILSRLRNK
jgi:glycosyltransferase involved in cell wall biosynthesis